MELYNALNESEQKLIVAQMKGILSNREWLVIFEDFGNGNNKTLAFLCERVI
jgi:hypothetical protein